MEFGFPLASKVIVLPAGTEMSGTLPDGKPGVRYTTKYAMAGANAVGQTVIIDGLNDQGLSFGLFYFPGFAEYPAVTAENAGKAMAPFEFGTWVLGSFASVDELKAALAQGGAVIVDTPAPGFGSSPSHYFVRDKSGQVHRHRAARRHAESVRCAARRRHQRARLRLAHHQPPQLRQSQRDQRAAARPRRRKAHAVGPGSGPAWTSRRFHAALALRAGGGLHPGPGGHEEPALDFRTFDDQTIRVIDLKEAVAAAGGKMRTIPMGLAAQPIADALKDFSPEQPAPAAP